MQKRVFVPALLVLVALFVFGCAPAPTSMPASSVPALATSVVPAAVSSSVPQATVVVPVPSRVPAGKSREIQWQTATNGELAVTVAENKELVALRTAAGKREVWLTCCDGRANPTTFEYADWIRRGIVNADVLPFEFNTLAASVTDEGIATLNALIDQGRVSGINVVTHGDCNIFSGCGAQGLKTKLDANLELGMQYARQHNIEYTAQWVQKGVYSNDVGVQSYYIGEKIWSGTKGRVPVTSWVLDHPSQTLMPISESSGYGLRTVVPVKFQMDPFGWKWAGETVPLGQLTLRAQQILGLNGRASAVLAPEVKALELATSQSFQLVAMSDGPSVTALLGRARLGQLDQAFRVSIMVSPGASIDTFLKEWKNSRAAWDYGLANAQGDVRVYVSSMERANVLIEEFKSSPPTTAFVSNAAKGSLEIHVVDGAGVVQQSLLYKPRGVAVGSVQVVAAAQPQKPAAVPTVVVIGPAPVAGDEAVQVQRFKDLSARLSSADGQVLRAVRDEMKALGAQFVDGQFVLVRGGRVWATGPIRSAVVSRYALDGKIASISYPTSRVGWITLERAENIPGIAGWRLSIPNLSLQGKSILGIPAEQVISDALVKGLTLVWVGFEASNFGNYINHVDHVDVSPTTLQTLRAPTGADYRVWLGTPDSQWVQTKWELKQEQLKSGWNGFKSIIPTQKEVPLFLYDGLAGLDIPKATWPSFGPEGHRISSDWTYTRTQSGYELRLDGQFIPTGSEGDYVSLYVSDFGMWLIPYHYSHATIACLGLCVQQSTGGEELVFDGKSQQSKAVELCPDPSACWRPK